MLRPAILGRTIVRRYAHSSAGVPGTQPSTYRAPTPPPDYDLTADHRLWRKRRRVVETASAQAARAQCKMKSISVPQPSPDYYQHRLPDRRYEVFGLYRALLREAARFFDPHAREYLRDRIRHRFKVYRDWSYPTRVNAKIKEARKGLRCLEAANHRRDCKASMKILELTYGRRGRRRHELLQPYLHRVEADAATSPLEKTVQLDVEGIPPMSAGLHALLTSQSRRIVLSNDPGLSPIRQRNLQRRHFKHILGEVTAPLPPAIHEEVSEKAQGSLVNMPVLWQKPGRPCRPIDTLPVKAQRRISKRMVRERRRQRRLYRHLLLKVPVLAENDQGGVRVERDAWSGAAGPLPSLSEEDCRGMSEDALQSASDHTVKPKKKKRYHKHQVQ
ncbi:hypothetical protein SYNPS1DRAFT_30247 [Syncephalis pseudoplumigaleata]|uniref:LYR motif-containing protein Cup1-like N-terminal domain-containing protein n=1 Tax=Syncephalis pseudoplumigaleata TaxID=1712513 RepID=A0A4P9YV98_9FUNG|nr:hypothetical protein SYNPS1DRAFT_30247 [Syncephalis pseudoplumigaleata]|eukprot:RKP23983.1 hypothetical protein SYNPS1DRAFT_30247 [Syncephalis pseudoplumigaleata]